MGVVMDMDMEMGTETDTVYLFWFEAKQTKVNLFRFCFGLFRKTKKKILVVLVFQNRFETNRNKKSTL